MKYEAQLTISLDARDPFEANRRMQVVGTLVRGIFAERTNIGVRSIGEAILAVREFHARQEQLLVQCFNCTELERFRELHPCSCTKEQLKQKGAKQ